MDNFSLGHGVYFYSEDSKLVKITPEEEKEVALDNLEVTILSFFIKNAGQVKSKHELLDEWPVDFPMESSLTRVISVLRKKLGDTDKNRKFIKTLNRKGYQYIGKTEPIDSSPEPAVITRPGNAQLHLLLIVLVLLALFLAYSQIFTPSPQAPVQQQSHFIEIYDNNAQKQDVASNLDGKKVAYSAKKLADTHWHLRLADLYSDQVSEYAKPGLNLVSPVWLNSTEVVYHQWNMEHCSIRKLDISTINAEPVDELIAECNSEIMSKGLAVLDEKTLLMSDSASLSEPLKLAKVDIASGAKQTIADHASSGHGAYRIYTSPKKKYLAILSSPDWFNTQIQVFKLTDLSAPIWQNMVSMPLYSVALSESTVIYKNTHGGLTIDNFVDDKIASLDMPFSKPIYNPVYTPNGVMVTEGDYFSTNVVLTNMETASNRAISRVMNATVRSPILVAGKDVVYASNQTGINQLWKYNLDSGVHSQISNFETAYFIHNIAASADGGEMVIETNKGMLLANMENGDLSTIADIVEGTMPSFWQGKLLYSIYKDHRSAVYVYGNSEQPVIDNGAFITVVDGDALYYAKYHQPGVWQYQADGKDIKIYDRSVPLVHGGWTVRNGNLFIGDKKSGVITRVNVETQQVFEQPMLGCRALHLVANNDCLTTKHLPAVNRLVKLTFKSLGE